MKPDFLGIKSFIPPCEGSYFNHSLFYKYEDWVEKKNVLGIKLVARGTEHYVVGNKRYSVRENHYVMIPGGRDFHCYVNENEAVEGFCLSLDEELLNKAYRQLCLSDLELLDNPNENLSCPQFFREAIYNPSGKYFDFLTRTIRQLKHLKDFSKDRAQEFYFEAAYKVVKVQKEVNVKLQKIPAAKDSTRLEIFARLNAAKSRIDSDLRNQFCLKNLARECYMSEFHFLRSFKNVFGLTPHQYIIKKRMEKAKQILISDNMPVADLAYCTGYEDASAFSKAFKKYYKVSPEGVRKEKK